MYIIKGMTQWKRRAYTVAYPAKCGGSTHLVIKGNFTKKFKKVEIHNERPRTTRKSNMAMFAFTVVSNSKMIVYLWP